MPEKTIEEQLYENYKIVETMDEDVESIAKEAESIVADTSKDLCAYAEMLKRCTSLIERIQNTITKYSGIISMTEDQTKYYLAEIILKKFQVNLLRLKKIILELKLKACKSYKKILKGTVMAKGSTMTALVAVPLAQYQAVAMAVNVVLEIISNLLKCIIALISVDAQGMTFFMTPKSIKNVQLNVLNPNMQNMDHLLEPVKLSIDKVIDLTRDANDIIKLANIARAADACRKILQAGGAVLSSVSFCANLKKIDCNGVFKLVRAILDLQLTPEPLPRYEDLKLTHLSFMTWLITGFEPAGHQAFGMPGFP